MPLLSFSDLPLRARFLAAMGIALIPLALVAVGAVVILQRSTVALQHIVEQPVYKLQATSRLQAQVLKTHVLIKDRGTARTRLAAEVEQVEAGFKEILAKPFLRPQERALLSIARDEWRHGIAPRQEQRLHGVTYVLDQIYDIYHSEIGDRQEQLASARHRFLMLLALVAGLGLAGALAGALLLARSMLRPLHELETGVAHLAHDDLGYRLPLHRRDELGQLAVGFNTMAEHLLAQHQRLEELSTRDGLTGLYNRREFDRRLNDELQRARRYDRPFAILLLDIDHFKLVNDHYGHQVGDEVLQTVSDLVRLNVRPVDTVCRYGGEELGVILPETGEDGALMVAERIRRMVAGAVVAVPSGETIHVTVSIGVAGFPLDAAGAPELVGVADAALYAAKRNGRNQVHRH